jgi:hypothetical protein
MTTAKTLKNTSHSPRGYLSIALVVLAGAIRVPPIFIEQIIPVVLGSLVRLRILPISLRQVTRACQGHLRGSHG